ncbi:hypothetical protein [Aeromicrobium endophyticum]|uniref:hypothetical protein n=1 Tax=Aeromicrobium endophyticum TaxID=2292704 RepID=UPI0011C4211D|nr:hypothetical protein [Aeromicrobium endophyticum]
MTSFKSCPRYHEQGLIGRDADQALFLIGLIPDLLPKNDPQNALLREGHHVGGTSRRGLAPHEPCCDIDVRVTELVGDLGKHSAGGVQP